MKALDIFHLLYFALLDFACGFNGFSKGTKGNSPAQFANALPPKETPVCGRLTCILIWKLPKMSVLMMMLWTFRSLVLNFTFLQRFTYEYKADTTQTTHKPHTHSSYLTPQTIRKAANFRLLLAVDCWLLLATTIKPQFAAVN